MPVAHGRDFRLYLRQELDRRCQKNPCFSLRAFARSLNIEASTLSKLIRGRRTLTKAMLQRLGAQLGLTAAEVDEFIEGLKSNH